MKYRVILNITLIVILLFGIWRVTMSNRHSDGHKLQSTQEQDEEFIDVFYTNTIEAIELEDTFRIEDYYITNRVHGSNRYYIDDNKVLWGYGNNEYLIFVYVGVL